MPPASRARSAAASLRKRTPSRTTAFAESTLLSCALNRVFAEDRPWSFGDHVLTRLEGAAFNRELAAAGFAAVEEMPMSNVSLLAKAALATARSDRRFAAALRLAARNSETLAAASAALMDGDLSASAMCVPGTALPCLALVVEI